MTAAKQRLAAVMDAQARSRLAAAMLEDVLLAAAGATGLKGLVVVTTDLIATEIAQRYKARVVSGSVEEGQTAAVRYAVRALADEGREAVLTLPLDVPLITPVEIDAVLAAGERRPELVIVPAHDRRGSNAILCAPPDHVPLSFGNDSFLPHLESARRHGVEPRILELPGIGLDIDNPSDLAAFMAIPSRTRTRAIVEGMGINLSKSEETE
jgi:2-phospho-L-lactate/phosphoenolpyruvate guanylyltransferase